MSEPRTVRLWLAFKYPPVEHSCHISVIVVRYYLFTTIKEDATMQDYLEELLEDVNSLEEEMDQDEFLDEFAEV